jgi:hypothetical protein
MSPSISVALTLDAGAVPLAGAPVDFGGDSVTVKVFPVAGR